MQSVVLNPKGLHGGVQASAEYQEMVALFAPLADAQQVVAAQLVNPLAVIADFADGAALLGLSLIHI